MRFNRRLFKNRVSTSIKMPIEKKYHVVVNINHYSGSILRLDDGYFTYVGKGHLIERIRFSDFETNPNCASSYLDKGFELYDFQQKECVPFSINNVLKQKDYLNHLNSFILQRHIRHEEVIEYFSYRITIQLKGKHITEFYPLSKNMEIINKDIITFNTYEGNIVGEYGKYGSTADRLFGKPFKSENGHLTDMGRYPYEYRVSINDIEKIFLKKEYRDITKIGSDEEYSLTGKSDILKLDLNEPDMELYNEIRKIEDCIEITWVKRSK